MSKKKTTAEFIRDAKRVHGRKYDYSLVRYKRSDIKVKIKCKIHGVYQQIPDNHLSGKGCPKCAVIYRANQRRTSLADFIKKATKVHQRKYDYSLVSYKDCHSKVEIVCKIHGSFRQTPGSHLSGSGCPACMPDVLRKKLSGSDKTFISRAKTVHGNRYSYRLVAYKNAKQRVVIVCKIHGRFLQTPSDHLSGCGCPKCAEMSRQAKNRKKREDFIDEATKLHGGKYDYSLVNYQGATKKICIICPIHGEFWQLPCNHLHHIQKQGCPSCGRLECANQRRMSQSDFLEKAAMVHGDQYDYSLVCYEASQIKVTIVCPTHGQFLQDPAGHLAGAGCPKCGISKCAEDRRLEQQDFIARAVQVHGEQYDYSLVSYSNYHAKVEIVCKLHGKFLQDPAGHLAGKGCPKCGVIACSDARMWKDCDDFAGGLKVLLKNATK